MWIVYLICLSFFGPFSLIKGKLIMRMFIEESKAQQIEYVNIFGMR